MNIVVSGSHGFIGSALVGSLTAAGHRVTRLVRGERSAATAGDAEIVWNPEAAYLDTAKLEGQDAVIHLAGEPIPGRWTPRKKARILESRFKGTRLLSEALAHLAQPPQVFVSGSAVGYYGNRSDEVLREESSTGGGFLAQVCREWEGATDLAAKKAIRVVRLRIGVVLGAEGGALGQMLLPFRMGLGGRIGSGKQYMSWIALDDLVGVVQHVLVTASLQGPVNAVAPNPAPNAEFVKTLGRVLSRPTLFPLPAFVVRLVFGQMGEEALLWGQRVEPARLKASGYTFHYPTLEGALRHVLGKA